MEASQRNALRAWLTADVRQRKHRMVASRKKSEYWKRPKSAPLHPYFEFEGTPLWRSVKKALRDLEKNQDLELKEWHQYVVGYLCKQLSREKLITPKAKMKKAPNQ